MIPERVRAYRETVLHSDRYYGWLHLAFTSLCSLAVIAWALSRVSDPDWKQFLIVPFTFFYANLVEYWGHRGPMHNPFRFMDVIYKRHAGEHHSYFTHDAMEAKSSREFGQVLFPPVMIVFFIGLFAVPVACGLGRWLAPNIGYLFLATGVAYFLNYEWFHFAYHMPADSWARRLPGMGTLLKLHTSHHNQQLMARHNFNITYPIGDWFFGTLHRG